MSEQPTTLALTLADKDVQRILSETIKAQVVLALTNHGERLIHGLVASTLNERRYSGGDSKLDELVKTEIQEAARAAVKQWCLDNAPAFQRAVEAEMKRNLKGLAKDMVDVFAKGLSDNYRTVVHFGAAPR